MPEPLVCTVNSYGNVDYGVPIVANKSTDYRTSTSTYHRHIPNTAQEFDIRVKPKINKELLARDVEIKDNNTHSMYSISYTNKETGEDTGMKSYRAKAASSIDYTRTVQEKRNAKVSSGKDGGMRPSSLRTENLMMIESENEISLTPPAIKEAAEIASLDLLPEKSRKLYLTVYGIFLTLENGKGVNSFSESVLILVDKMFQEPPPPLKPGLSEMKDSYRRNFKEYNLEKIYPPKPYAECEIKGLDRDEQPPVHPEEKGYWKLLDPYLTTSRLSYVPFTKEQHNGIARKDIVTFYDAHGYPKCKGFGPKNGIAVEPLVSRRGVVYDKITFKKPAYDRTVHIPAKRVPNQGMNSEYRSNFRSQTFSYVYPYLFENGVEYTASHPDAGRDQNMASPGMYKTDYSAVSDSLYVNSVVDTDGPKKLPPHKPCSVKVAIR